MVKYFNITHKKRNIDTVLITKNLLKVAKQELKITKSNGLNKNINLNDIKNEKSSIDILKSLNFKINIIDNKNIINMNGKTPLIQDINFSYFNLKDEYKKSQNMFGTEYYPQSKFSDVDSLFIWDNNIKRYRNVTLKGIVLSKNYKKIK